MGSFLTACLWLFLCSVPLAHTQGCDINLQNNLPKKSDPVYLERSPLGTGRLQYKLPEPSGSIVLAKGQELLLGCTGSKNTLNATGLDLTSTYCDVQFNLTVNGTSRDSSTLNCTKRSLPALFNTKTNCDKNSTLIELGFQVQSQWLPLAASCHNIDLSSTLWSRHTIYGSRLAGRVFEDDRPGFSRGLTELYAGFDPDLAYQQKSQSDAFLKLYGPNSTYIKPNTQYFLARGHLAPDADFLFASWQMMTYFFVNAAPQWQIINAGNWLAVEDNSRDLAIKINQDLLAYTGTQGVLNLRSDDGSTKAAYLYGGNRIPVPDLYWKLLVEPTNSSCIALLSTNNPYLASPPQTLCPDICSQAGWPLLQNNLTRGYVYCCEYSAFKAAVPTAPSLSCTNLLRFS